MSLLLSVQSEWGSLLLSLAYFEYSVDASKWCRLSAGLAGSAEDVSIAVQLWNVGRHWKANVPAFAGAAACAIALF